MTCTPPSRTRVRLLTIVCLLLAGCGKSKSASDHDRMEAAHLASEAQFAMNVREWRRAEDLLVKAAKLDPSGDYYLTLGAARLRQNNRSGAKDAYQSALRAYENEASRHRSRSEPWLRQAYVLALLGRLEDSRALLAKARKAFPNDVKVRSFADPKEFDRMITSPKFKDAAL